MVNKTAMTRERKIILLAGAFLLVIGAMYRFWPAIVSTVSVADDIAFKTDQVEKYQQIAARKDQVVKENAGIKKQFRQMESRLLTGSTPSLSAVEIQNTLNAIAEAVGVKFSTMRVMKAVESEEADYVRVPVQFSMDSDILQFKDLIYQIETSSRLLVVSELDIRQLRSRDGYRIRSVVTVEGVMETPAVAG